MAKAEDLGAATLFGGTCLRVFTRTHCEEDGDLNLLGDRDGLGVIGMLGQTNRQFDYRHWDRFLVSLLGVLEVISSEELLQAEAYLSVGIVPWIRQSNCLESL